MSDPREGSKDRKLKRLQDEVVQLRYENQELKRILKSIKPYECRRSHSAGK